MASSRSKVMQVVLGVCLLLAAWFLVQIVIPVTWTLLLSEWSVIRYGEGAESELLRVASPDGKVDAVLVRTSAAAGDDYDTFQVYLVVAGSKDFHGQTKAEQKIQPILDGFGGGFGKLQFRWVKRNLLDIAYSDTCIDIFVNHWCSGELDGCKEKVEIRLLAPNDETSHLCKEF